MSNVVLAGIQSTAGAVPVRNEKGEISMQKVKVQRYISGKRPDYARGSSSEDSDLDDFLDHRKRAQQERRHRREHETSHEEEQHRQQKAEEDEAEAEVDDPRLRRLRIRPVDQEDLERERRERHRQIHEPEFVESESDDESDDDDDGNEGNARKRSVERTTNKITLASESDSDSEISDDELEKRRLKLRQRMLQQQKEEEILQKEDENKSETSESESSEYEEETESEEDNEPRLKPLFVRKNDRATIQEKEREAEKQKQLEVEAKRAAKERRRNTLRLVEESVKKELEKNKPDTTEADINDVCTDDENDEVEYEAWKLRELKRIKRDREERENAERDKLEIERLRTLTDEERRQELRQNPKIITNKAAKGKYKFLQKYYHRGAFYLDEENDVLKRDFSEATLEDHFDKTILPKVMQVKNFGRCGRTKYTHLVDQDTTKFDSPWYAESTNNIKFHNEKAGGMKQHFDRPSRLSKRKKME